MFHHCFWSNYWWRSHNEPFTSITKEYGQHGWLRSLVRIIDIHSIVVFTKTLPRSLSLSPFVYTHIILLTGNDNLGQWTSFLYSKWYFFGRIKQRRQLCFFFFLLFFFIYIVTWLVTLSRVLWVLAILGNRSLSERWRGECS